MQKDLIIKLKTGNEEAFKSLVDTHHERVLNTCFHFLHDRLDAEDLAQEVFIEVYRSIGRFREDAQISTWIYRIAVNKSLDYIRKKKRKKRFSNLLSYFGAADEPEIQIATEIDPQKDLESQERLHILNTAIESLTENQKAAITLSKYEGFSNKQIADILGTSLAAVESLIHRAKKNLHKKISRYYEKNLKSNARFSNTSRLNNRGLE